MIIFPTVRMTGAETGSETEDKKNEDGQMKKSDMLFWGKRFYHHINKNWVVITSYYKQINNKQHNSKKHY